MAPNRPGRMEEQTWTNYIPPPSAGDNILFKGENMISAVGAVQAHIKSISCDTERGKYLL